MKEYNDIEPKLGDIEGISKEGYEVLKTYL